MFFIEENEKITNDEIRRKLIESLVMNETIKTDELTRRAQEVEDPEKTAEVIQECKSIIRMKKKSIIRIAYSQDKFLKKLKDKKKFITLVNKVGIHKITRILKIHIFKLCEEYPKLFNSSIGL